MWGPPDLKALDHKPIAVMAMNTSQLLLKSEISVSARKKDRVNS